MYICVEELLELRRSLLLSATIVGIVVIEQAFPESPLPRQSVVDGALAGIAVEFAPLAAFQEEKVNLSVIVARRALWQMEPLRTTQKFSRLSMFFRKRYETTANGLRCGLMSHSVKSG